MEQVCLVVCHVRHCAVVGDKLLLLLHLFLHLLAPLPGQCCYPVDPDREKMVGCIMSILYLLAAVSFAFMLEAMVARGGGQPSGRHLSENNNILPSHLAQIYCTSK